MNNKAQGAIEYLLIIGAAILVVAVVLIAIMSLLSQGQGQNTSGTTTQDTAHTALDQLKKDALGIVSQNMLVNQGDSFIITFDPVSGTTLATMFNGATGTIQVNGTAYDNGTWGTAEIKKTDTIYIQTLTPTNNFQTTIEGIPDKSIGTTCNGTPTKNCTTLNTTECASFSECTIQTNNLYNCQGTIASTFCSSKTSSNCNSFSPTCNLIASSCILKTTCSAQGSALRCNNLSAAGCRWIQTGPTNFVCAGSINPAYCTVYSSNQAGCSSRGNACAWIPSRCNLSQSTCSTMPWLSSCSASNSTCANCGTYGGTTTECSWNQNGITQSCITGTTNPICAGQNETNCSTLGCTWN